MEHFYLAALEALGGAATGEDMYQKFLELGFKTGARNQKDAIKTYFRQRGKFMPLPPDEYGVVRWTLKQTEWRIKQRPGPSFDGPGRAAFSM